MIFYCNHEGVKKEINYNFILNKFKEVNSFWNYKVFSDHIGFRDRLVMLNAIRKKLPFIFYSLESSIHGLKYWRPYPLSTFNISHKNLNKKKTLWYTAFAEEYLSLLQVNIKPAEQKSSKILFISSNTNKIKEVEVKMGQEFKELDFYGIFSKNVLSTSFHAESWRNFHLDSNKIMANNEVTLALENSNEDGYIQGIWMRAIKAKSVPIIKASESVKKRVLDTRAFIEFDDFIKMTKSQREKKILKVKDFLYSDQQVLSSLILDYLSFMKEVDLSDFNKAIKKSQYFRDKVFPE